MKNEKLDRLGKLFMITFSISAVTNGGWAIISSMKSRFVEEYKWLSEQEMVDFISMAQSAPGPIAVNASVLVGYHIGGFAGALSAVLGTILPPLVIMNLVTFFYSYIVDNELVRATLKGMQAGVAAILVDIVISLFINVSKQKSWLSYLIMLAAFIAVRFGQISVFYIVVATICLGVLKALYLNHAGRGEKNEAAS